jgi:hypothetical protein
MPAVTTAHGKLGAQCRTANTVNVYAKIKTQKYKIN